MLPLNYLQSTIGLIWVLSCIPLGFVLTAISYIIINKIPATWLCDYNETPSDELLSGKRINYKKSGIILSIVASICLILCRLQFNKGYDIYFILLALIIFVCLMIAVSDMKYTIIPDQFTAALGVLALIISVYDILRGYHILHQSWWSPLAGALLGSIVMLLIDFLGMLIYKQDGMGFGDVKLFFAVGIFTGFPGTIYSIILSIFIAAICFVIIMIVSRIMYAHNSNSDEIQEEQAKTQTADNKEISTDNSKTVENSEMQDQETNEDTVSETEKQIEENTEENTEEQKTPVTGKSQLAFGPYIAIAVIAYVVFFDYIAYLARLYTNLL